MERPDETLSIFSADLELLLINEEMDINIVLKNYPQQK